LAAAIAPKDRTINYLLAREQLAANYPRRCIDTLELLTPVDAYYSTWYGGVRQWLLDRAYYSVADYRRALDNADFAVEKRPGHIWSYHRKVRALAALDRLQEIDTFIDQCLNIAFDYGSPATIMSAAARELRVQGRYARARGYADRAAQWCRQQPDPYEYRENFAEALRLAERWSEAQMLFAQLNEENPDNVYYLGKLGTLAARLGDESEARKIQDALENWDPLYTLGVHLFWCAAISSVLGDHEQAVVFLQEAIRQGLDGRDYVIEEMAFEPLRDYRRFQDLIRPQD
jgi:tetratricopeptide (TPR) repeat protein